MKVSDLFVKALENEGVEYIFGLPGEENIDLLESIRKSDIQFVLTRHEQGAGFMAATYGRLTGKPGVCLSTLGPGATNMVTSTAYAQLGAMPLVVITGQKPIKQGKQGQFQIIDVVEMMEPITKCSKQVGHGEHVPSMIREAFRLAKEERPGAVHIELPEDIAQEELSGSRLFDVVDYIIPTADLGTIKQAAEMIRAASKPLILIGASANRMRACQSLSEFVDGVRIPFFNTQMGKGIIDERHPLFLGTAALSDYDFVHEAIDDADLIINVGHDTIEKPPFFMHIGDGRQVIHINFFPAEIDEVYFPQLNVIGDIAQSIRNLGKELMRSEGTWDTSSFMRIKENVDNHLSKYANDNRFPLLPQRLVKITRDALPENAMITLDNGMYKIWFARNYPTYFQNGLLLDNALATMGAGLASAVMAKILNPDRVVVSINGDGGFLMNSQEMETAARLGLDLIIIVLRDNAYGMIKWKQEGEGFKDYGLTYLNPDFEKYAESFGARGYRPESVDEFIQIFGRVVDEEKGIHLIDLAVDYSLNHEILNVIIKEYSGKRKNEQ